MIDLFETRIREAKMQQPDEVVVCGNYDIYSCVGSTMDKANEAIRAGDGFDGKTIVAHIQTAGRGSVDSNTGETRRWWSGEDAADFTGNAFFTRIVNVNSDQHALEKAFYAALAVAELIAPELPRAEITFKYPNDILIDGKKVTGCLVESKDEQPLSDDPEAHRLIAVGVGVNLAVPPPATVISTPTCLRDHGLEWKLHEFLPLFEQKFTELVLECPRFEDLLKRVGFAHEITGEITLHEKETGTMVRGTYAGFSAESMAPGSNSYVEYLHLQTEDGVAKTPLKAYATSAIISRNTLSAPPTVTSFAAPNA